MRTETEPILSSEKSHIRGLRAGLLPELHTRLKPELHMGLLPELQAGLLPELLAPAGDRDSFFAALAAGADAIYLGLKDFNARRGAENFELEDLRYLCDIAHLAQKRVYLTLNIAILNSEFDEALELARQAWVAGIDAVIAYDPGLIQAITRDIPQLKIHASTQLNAHNSTDIEAMVALGVKRVTLARELSLKEVAELSSLGHSLGIETEIFAHGALCFCYSGHCLMSSLIGARSANRGLCAQPCRLPWSLIDISTNRAIKVPGEYLLSTGDLCTLPILKDLVASGTTSLKIEGRMKSATYVSTVVRTYRAALDALLVSDTSEAVSPESRTESDEVLSEVFSRTLTTAYLGSDRSNTMMSYQRPNNRGALIGRVADRVGTLTGIELTRAVQRSDILEAWTSKGNAIITLDRFYTVADTTSTPALSAPARTVIYLEGVFGLRTSDRVFRVYNSALEDKAQQSFEGELFVGNKGLVPVIFEVKAHIGMPLRVTACCGEVRVSVTGPVVEPARTKTITSAEINEHICRVGSTPFTVDACTVELDEGAGIGFSSLHATRSQALAQLSEKILTPWRQRRLLPAPPRVAPAPARRGNVQLAVLVKDAAGARAAVNAGARIVFGHTLELEPKGPKDHSAFQATLVPSPRAGAKLKVLTSPWLPAIAHDHELPALEKYLVEGNPLVANTPGLLRRALARGAAAQAGPSIPVYNQETLLLLARLGAQRIWLGPELSYKDLETLTPESPVPLGITISGFAELMVSEHCILMAQGACNQDCIQCTRRKTPRLLEDRKNYRFAVRTDSAGRSHIYNAVPLDLLAEIPRLLSLGITGFLVDATLLSTSEITEEVKRASRAVDLAVRGVGSLPKREGYTTGHLFRGVQ